MNKYIPSEIEEKWIDIWEREKVYEINDDKNKKKIYTLSMFPYPSGTGLHVGHVRIYTGTDVLARYFRMKGYQVIHPMGWDAFGLPAENAAIKEKKNPMDIVPENISNFKKQMNRLGYSLDWRREFSTTDSDYYKWTQWLFIQFYKKGLLYKKNTPVNFCPKCKTGLAEEEVLADGTHERCGEKIEKRDLPQWMFKITDYADRLLSDLEGLDWPSGIIQMQKNWIGKSIGVEIDFKIDLETQKEELIRVFTTRPDTIFGVTALIVAPEHNLIKSILNKKISVDENCFNKISKYVKESKSKSDLIRTELTKNKTGVFTNCYAINPVNGEKIPIWVADYVLGWYGHGALMLVPAHDVRDFDFAKKYGLKIKHVITKKKDFQYDQDGVFTENGFVIPNKEAIDFLQNKDLFIKPLDSSFFGDLITKEIEKKNIGSKKTQYKIRDWIFSRQRYWGEPIPIINCEKCGYVTVPEDELPVKLPYVKSYEPTSTGESPLSKISDFVNVKCPKCGGNAKRETDTMPNWAGSCWYFIRFADAKNKSRAWDKDIANHLLPVDWYLGGQEHAVLHLLYSRFWTKILFDMGLINFKEPFLRLRNVGMVLATDHKKMSKSLGNVINPDDVISEYGADTTRVYEMFMAPFSSENSWSTSSMLGSYRFLSRVWQMFNSTDKLTNNENEQDIKLVAKLQSLILKIDKEIPDVKFNTSIAMLMEFLNEWEKSGKLAIIEGKKYLKILSIFAPFISETIWRDILKENKSINYSLWPEVNEKLIKNENFNIAIQVNGKLRDVINIESGKIEDEDFIISEALKQPNILRYVTDRKYKKVIYINKKIISFVV